MDILSLPLVLASILLALVIHGALMTSRTASEISVDILVIAVIFTVLLSIPFFALS